MPLHSANEKSASGWACRLLHAAALIVLIIATAGCRSTGNRQTEDASTEPTAAAPTAPSEPAPPLLVVDTDAPLLLDEHAEPAPTAPAGGADNSPCLVCHANYRHEGLAATHAAAKIGCAACHGESIPHRNDENNTIPPEKMFARDIIDNACGKCHKGHDVAPAKVIARYTKRGLDITDTDAVVCTDCHGDHRLKLRTVTWDKKTGDLLQTNKQ